MLPVAIFVAFHTSSKAASVEGVPVCFAKIQSRFVRSECEVIPAELNVASNADCTEYAVELQF